MEKTPKYILNGFFILVFLAGSAVADINKTEHDMDAHEKASIARIGDLFHESVVDGFMLAYHILDLRDPKADGMEKATMDRTYAMTDENMDKPYHLCYTLWTSIITCCLDSQTAQSNSVKICQMVPEWHLSNLADFHVRPLIPRCIPVILDLFTEDHLSLHCTNCIIPNRIRNPATI